MSKVMRAKYFSQEGILKAKAKQSSSWIWRSWVHSRYLLEEGTRHQVGSGKAIKVWDHQWLPIQPYRILSPRPHHTSISTVEELMDREGKCWDKEVLGQLFSPQEVEIILAIPISQLGAKDRLVWKFSKDGIYSVKSGQHLAMQLAEVGKQQPEHSNRQQEDKRKWRVLWQLQVKQKVKLFFWKCLHGTLPVKANLLRRKFPCDPVCAHCGEVEETVEHVLFQCKKAQEVWKLAPISWNTQPTGQGEIMGWWEDVCKATSAVEGWNRLALTVTLCWQLWKARCKLQFQQNQDYPMIIVNKALGEWREFQEADDDRRKKRLAPSRTRGEIKNQTQPNSQQADLSSIAVKVVFDKEHNLARLGFLELSRTEGLPGL